MSSTTLYITGQHKVYYISKSDDSSFSAIDWKSDSGQSFSSATLTPVFILLFGVPGPLSGVHTAALENFVTAVNTAGGQQLFSTAGQLSQAVSCFPFSQKGSGQPQPISNYNQSLVGFSPGDQLLVPLTQSLPSRFNLNNFYDAINTAYALPATISSSSASPVASPTPATVMSTITTTPTPSMTTLPPAPTSSPNAGAIAGGVVGGLAGLALIVTVVVLLWRRQRPRAPKLSPNSVPDLSEVGQPGSGTPGFQGSTYSPRSLRTDGSLRQSGGW